MPLGSVVSFTFGKRSPVAMDGAMDVAELAINLGPGSAGLRALSWRFSDGLGGRDRLLVAKGVDIDIDVRRCHQAIEWPVATLL